MNVAWIIRMITYLLNIAASWFGSKEQAPVAAEVVPMAAPKKARKAHVHLSQETKELIAKRVAEGMAPQVAADTYMVSVSTVNKIVLKARRAANPIQGSWTAGA